MCEYVCVDNEKYMFKLGREEIPNYTSISHYTDIDTLIKILETQTFRFTRIDRVNDLSEKNHVGWHDFSDNEKNRVFVACFTSNRYESFPMWALYGKYERGVMLQLSFKNSEAKYNLFNQNLCNGYLKCEHSGDSYIKCPEECFMQEFYVRVYVNKMIYSLSAGEESKMNIANENPQRYNIPQNYAIIKNKCWEYEKEIRYKALICSKTKCEFIPFKMIPEYLDLKINYDCIKKMTVIFNPWISAETRIEFEKHIMANSKYHNIEFKNSSTHGEIRKVEVLLK